MALFFRPVDRFPLRLERAEYMIGMILYNIIIDLASLWPRQNRRADLSRMSRLTGMLLIVQRCMSVARIASLNAAFGPLSQLTVAPIKAD